VWSCGTRFGAVTGIAVCLMVQELDLRFTSEFRVGVGNLVCD